MIELDELLSELRAEGVQLWVHAGELRFRHPRGALDPGRLSAIRARKAEIVARLQVDPITRATPLGHEPRPALLPLSPTQEGLWFLDQLGVVGAAYNLPYAVRLRGALDVAALRGALDALARRHEILRTRFPAVDGVAAQSIEPPGAVAFAALDLSPLAPEQRAARAAQWVEAQAAYVFDLQRECPFRVGLLRLAPDEHVLAVNMHHLITDGWSNRIFEQELSELYAAALDGRAPALAPLPAQYADYALWQRRWLRGDVSAEQFAYWKQRLAGAPESLDLPTDRVRPATPSFRGGLIGFELPADLSAGLGALARRCDATRFMLVLAAFQLVLARWSGQHDVSVGTSIAGRGHRQAEALIGYFVNMLVLRTDLSGDPTFARLLERVKAGVIEAYEHSDLPFDKLVAELRPVRDLSRQPLFQVAFTYQGFADGDALRLRGLEPSVVELQQRSAQFDLSLLLSETATGLCGSLDYNTDLFERATVERLAGHLRAVLEAIVADPERPLSTLPMLAPAERALLLETWNDTAAPVPAERCLHELFAAQAARTPDAPALVHAREELTYAELDGRANQLAHHLRELGVGPETLVALCTERTPDMVVGLLAILKAGGAYVPLDPAYPAERLEHMLADTAAPVLLTHTALLERLPAHRARVVCLDRDRPVFAQRPRSAPPNRTRPANLAYCIYTSGSTGKPKGVALQHAGAVAFVTWAARTFAREQTARTLCSTSICFDLSVYELFVPLLSGGTVQLVENALALAPAAGFAPDDAPPTLINTVPSAAQALLDGGQIPPGVLTINLAGEPLARRLAERLHAAAPGAAIWNLYGPSEYTTYATACRVDSEPAAPVTIGRPIDNTAVYLLDDALEPVPLGALGELHVAGAGLARGYLNRPALSAERFVPDPFGPPGGRMYKTGDLARYLPDGRLEFRGRRDHQIKLRGFRIELGEIESALLRHPALREAVVLGREDQPGLTRLVAYVVATDALTPPAPDELRRHLQRSLPEYMLPAAWVFAPALPLGPNGKLDRTALPAPDNERAGLGADYAAPRNPTEEVLAAIWADVLKLPRVGIHDNFFLLGGHSLLATQVVVRTRDALHTELSLLDFFAAPTLERLALHLASARGSERRTIVPAPRGGALPASFAQQRLWFLEQYEPGSGVYTIPAAWELRGPLDRAALRRSLDEIVRRHEALRTVFGVQDETPVQIVREHAPVALPVLDLSAAPDRAAATAHALQAEAERPFDLARGPLLRARLLALGPDEHVLLLAMHHIVSDGWSLGILMRELGVLYRAFSAGAPSPLPELAIQYADFALWQRDWLQGARLDEQLAYWRRTLDGAPAVLELPHDRPRPALQTHRGAVVEFALGPDLSAALNRLARARQVTPFMLLAAAFALLLQRYAGQDDICIGYPVANRNHGQIEDLIGFFVNTLVLRARPDPARPFTALLAQVREAVLQGDAHQDVPFEKLVEELRPQRSLSHPPLFSVMLSYNNNDDEGGADLPGLALRPLEAGSDVTKFELTLGFVERAGELLGSLEYNTDLFDRGTVERMEGHLRTLLAAVVADPELPLARLPILTPAERERALATSNGAPLAFPADDVLHERFARQAARAPDAVALVDEHRTLTYAQLDARANQLAHHLRELGVGPGTLVPLCFERSLEMIVALLGVLKAGGAYVPLDPEHPHERLAYMLADTAAPVLLTQAILLDRLPDRAGTLLCLDRDWPTIARRPSTAPTAAARPHDVAYCIYTSGSTGKPKGVLVTHHNVLRLFAATDEQFAFGPSDVWSLFHSYAFDFSVWEIFGALLHGGKLVVVPLLDAKAPDAFIELIDAHGVTVLNQTPSAFGQLVAALPADDDTNGPRSPRGLRSVRQVIFGGEALDPAALAPWIERYGDERPVLTNMYGITETTVHVTRRVIRAADARDRANSPIGQPIADLQLYVLDADLNPVPVGAPGELYVGGAGLARGYLNRPGLTAERFIPHPFSRVPGARLYRTGDRAKYRSDGDIAYLGRIDQQVKLRGYRIELGEIESALAAHPGVREAAVIVGRNGAGEPALSAFFVPRPGAAPDVAHVRVHLRAQLPEYMIPATILRLEALPLTANGKLDRTALAAIDRVPEERRFVAPQTPLEQAIAEIWQDVLGVENVSTGDDFFDLGGHSLAVVKIVSRINGLLDIELRVRAFYEHPTVAALAEHVLRRVLGDEDGSDEPFEWASTLAKVPWVDDGAPLPATARALSEEGAAWGLLAAGGTITPARLEEGARKGIFPLYNAGNPVMWWAPERRMVLPADELRLVTNMRRIVRGFARRPACEIRVDTAFDEVLEACATMQRKGQDGRTWILPEMARAYRAWHAAGAVHSVEAWMDGELAGGLFAIGLGKMVYVESMFARRTDASKIALAAFVAFCRRHGIALIDLQLYTPHLESMGGRLIPRADFERHLVRAVDEPPVAEWRFEPSMWDELGLDASAQPDPVRA